MSAPRDIPYITTTKAGVAVDLPVQQVPRQVPGGGTELRPVAVSRNPKISFPPPIAIGEGSVRRNYDIDEFIVTDWSGGMGEDTYQPATTPSSYQWGQADSRFPGTLVCRPLATQLGSNVAAMNFRAARVVELNYTNAALLWYAVDPGPGAGQEKGYRYTGSAWTVIKSGGVDINGVTSHALGLTGIVITGHDGSSFRVYRSADGVTWDKMSNSGGTLNTPQGIAIFDDKVWVVDRGGATGALIAYSSADLWSAAAGAGTWVAGAQTIIPDAEEPIKLFTWMDPTDRGRPTLWLLTNARLLYYDYYAATPSWREWFVLQTPQQASRFQGTLTYRPGADCVVSPLDGNLYVGVFGKEWIWQFTGATITRMSWNKRGGMPPGTRLSPLTLDANGTGVYAFCGPHPADSASKGAVVFADEGGQFHPLYDQDTNEVYGGGVGANQIWVVTPSGSNGQVWRLENPDALAVPPNVTGRTFDSANNNVYTGWINCGLPNVNKRAIHVEIDCKKPGGGNGLEAGATLLVAFVLTRTQPPVVWINFTTLTSASTFPAELDFASIGGEAVSFKEIRFWLILKRGTATSATPILRAFKLGYRPRPKQRHTYSVRVDVRDEAPAFQTTDGKWRGHSATWYRQYLDELASNDDSGQDDPLVGLAYGGEGNSLHPRYRSIPQCEVLIQSQEDPLRGDGLYLLTLSDLSPPSPG
jgi:hypothetical protein